MAHLQKSFSEQCFNPLKANYVCIHMRVYVRAKSLQSYPTLCNAMDQVSLSAGFSRQEYLNGLPCPPPGDLPNPGLEPMSLSLLH